MRLLITRPRDDAAALAKLLEASGHHVFLEPLLNIEPTGNALPPSESIAAIIFTSANGVRAYAAISQRRDLPVYAVGDRTAALAREKGFAEVRSAAGDTVALEKLIRERQSPAAGRLMHIAGTDVAGDLAGSLRGYGYAIDRVVLYRASPSADLSMETIRRLERRELDGILFYSPRTASLFAQLVMKAGLARKTSGLHAWCLSQAVAAALPVAIDLDVEIAPQPTQESLLGLIKSTARFDTAAALEN